MAWGCNAMVAPPPLCFTGGIFDLHHYHKASLPGPRASACVPVKCWVPERERSRDWGDGAAGCRRADASVCTSVRQRCCWPAWGHHRSGRGGLHRGATPAPGYSVQPREEQTEHEYLVCACERVWVYSQNRWFIFSHRAGVDCEGTLDEVELQYAGLQGGMRRCDHLLLLLLLLLLWPSPLPFVRDYPQVVALCSPALERESRSGCATGTKTHFTCNRQ